METQSLGLTGFVRKLTYFKLNICYDAFKRRKESIILEFRGGFKSFRDGREWSKGFLGTLFSTGCLLGRNLRHTPGETHFISVPNIFNNKGQMRSLFFSVLALTIIAHSMLTYAVRFLCGVKNT